MLSERARLQWSAHVQERGNGTALFQERDELHRFLVGVHIRGEVLSTADLSEALDEAGLAAPERADLVERVEWGLALLDSYTRQLEMEEEAYTEVHEYGGFEI